MILKSFDQRIRRAFSNSALRYEALAGLQREIGRELIQRVQQREDCTHILDVGMGTGRLTNRLQFFFPEARVVGMDFASGMVDCARKKYESLSIVQADARRLPFRARTFDIVFSNLAYQWIDDLPGAFREHRRVLKQDGTFCFTMFGQRTLEELFSAMEATLDGVGPIQRLATGERVVAAMKSAGFSDVELDSEIITVHFDDMLSLVQWLKDTGANALNQNVFLGKERLSRANAYYAQQFRDSWGVYASFEVLWLSGQKSLKNREVHDG